MHFELEYIPVSVRLISEGMGQYSYIIVVMIRRDRAATSPTPLMSG
jgi:hypothetical protein